MKNRRGQVSIFIVVGIVVVVAILGTIFFSERKAGVIRHTSLNPRDVVESCVRNVVKVSIKKMLKNGGEIFPSQAISYNGDEWNYLCFQTDFYQGCYNTHPMLESQIAQQIAQDTSVGVQTCFNSMKEDFQRRGFEVNGGGTSYSITLLPGYVEVHLRKNIKISGEGGTQSFDDFGIRVQSPLYRLVQIARIIVNSESQFCNFEYNGYMLLYPEYNIRRIDYDGSKMYELTDRKTGDEFKFAVRSCAFAPGI